MVPSPGQIVHVRSRQYLVEEVVRPPDPAEQTLVRLSCLEDDAQGAPLAVLWEKEVDAREMGGAAWSKVAARGFDPPHLFSAYLHTLRWNCVTSTNPRLFQAPYRAGIEVMAYQLEPLRKALLLPRVNLFIADDVGLGKTIEAGLILRELIIRQKVRRMVVACPPSVVLQWQEELESRFGLSFVVFDRAYVGQKRRERGYAVNPWTTHSRFIISHALLRDEAYAGTLRDWIDDFAPASLLILDEAHNAAPASGAKYAIDSHFTRAIRDLAHRFEHRLFLSATPHNGHSNSFAALLELLDPQRFCRGVQVKSAKLRDAVMVRRLKADLREIAGGFPKRIVAPIEIDGLPGDAPELRLSKLLDDYATLRERRLGGSSRSAQAAAGLVVTSLQKRLLSSIEAFACTLRVHRRSLEKQAREASAGAQQEAPTGEQLAILRESPGRDDERAELSEDEVRAEEEAAMEAATAAGAPAAKTKEAELLRRELELVGEMTEIAEAARGLPDPRIRELVGWIRENLCPGLTPPGSRAKPNPPAAWNDRRVLIFTEYVDTKRYLEQQLRAAIAGTDRAEERIRTFHGQVDDETREEVKRAFNADPAKHPLRILVATDAAREGVNLQNHCADLFHFDLPWNPSRMEQRNGRIDRKLQRAPEVRCHYFVLRQRPADRVLEALVRKTAVIEQELGSLSPVIERRLEGHLERGIRAAEADRLTRAIESEGITKDERATAEEELEAVRERKTQLSAQLDQLRDLLGASRDHIGLDETHLRATISSALELLGAKPLEPVRSPSPGKGPKRWRFPDLDRRAGADPSWADTLDTLRPRRRRDQPLWDWRRDSPIRPVVFEDPGTLDEEVAHLHLEHRVVRRLLGRFLAQGFVHDDLSRACVVRAEDAIPRVVLLGRLSLHGEGAARLHDEIVPVTARWADPETKRAPLRPYAAEAEARTIELLEKTLAEAGADVPERVRASLLRSVVRDVEDLLPHLEARAAALAERARTSLAARGEKEAKEMAAILEEQRKRIEATRRRLEDPQLTLPFSDDEKRQLDADRRHWGKRLGALETELEREPARIRAGYEVRATRVEPVGLVYLWPVSG